MTGVLVNVAERQGQETYITFLVGAVSEGKALLLAAAAMCTLPFVDPDRIYYTYGVDDKGANLVVGVRAGAAQEELVARIGNWLAVRLGWEVEMQPDASDEQYDAIALYMERARNQSVV